MPSHSRAALAFWCTVVTLLPVLDSDFQNWMGTVFSCTAECLEVERKFRPQSEYLAQSLCPQDWQVNKALQMHGIQSCGPAALQSPTLCMWHMSRQTPWEDDTGQSSAAKRKASQALKGEERGQTTALPL